MDCIFCQIAEKKMPSYIVYENGKTVAFLDLKPRSKGMCIVVPKEHFENFDDNFELATKTFESALVTGEMIKKALQPLTMFFSVYQAQVPHFHVRVYPVYEDQIPLIENKALDVSEAELTAVADRIKKEAPKEIEKKAIVLENKIGIAEKEHKKPKKDETKTKEKSIWFKQWDVA